MRRCTARLWALSMVLLSIPLAGAADAGVVTWTDANGDLHGYELVVGDISWDDAKLAADLKTYAGAQGHLATITSAAEQSFILGALFPQTGVVRAHIGGFQPAGTSEPSGGWSWVTGEAWTYTNWWVTEPNDNLTGEDHLEFLPGAPYHGRWNDIDSTLVLGSGSYIVEYDLAAVPLPPAGWMGLVVLAGIAAARRLRRRGSPPRRGRFDAT